MGNRSRQWKAAIISLLVLLCLKSVVVNSSNLNYNPYQYDLTTPQFTPDGRLLQVEYASQAVSEKSVLMIFPMPLEGQTTADSHTQQLHLVISHHPKAGMERLVVVENKLVALAGIVADNLYLLRKVRDANFQQRKIYRESLSTPQMANVIARECQRRSFGGGIRPFGATMIVCGRSEGGSNEILRTDPSGAVVSIDGIFLLGGSSLLQRKLRSMKAGKTVKDTLDNIQSVLNSREEDCITEVAIISKQGVYKLSSRDI